MLTVDRKPTGNVECVQVLQTRVGDQLEPGLEAVCENV